jgi:hypothetical protein
MVEPQYMIVMPGEPMESGQEFDAICVIGTKAEIQKRFEKELTEDNFPVIYIVKVSEIAERSWDITVEDEEEDAPVPATC